MTVAPAVQPYLDCAKATKFPLPSAGKTKLKLLHANALYLTARARRHKAAGWFILRLISFCSKLFLKL